MRVIQKLNVTKNLIEDDILLISISIVIGSVGAYFFIKILTLYLPH